MLRPEASSLLGMRYLLAVLCVCLGASFSLCGPVEAGDSLTEHCPGQFDLRPVGRIVPDAIDECSGIARLGDHWYTHNDSGALPVLYRAASPSFENALAIALEGAAAVDWEAITVDGEDLLVCDIGDNRRQRDDLCVYRVRGAAAATASQPTLKPVATYAIAYPDGKHDAEGVFVKGGKLHIIVKNRGEPKTSVFAFALTGGADTPEVGTEVATLSLPRGEQVTAAAYDSSRGALTLLSYGALFTYLQDRLAGLPLRTTRLYARQCEALAWDAGRLWFTNEQRDVFVIDAFLDRRIDEALPKRRAIHIPESAQGNHWMRYPLKHGGHVSFAATDATLLIRGRVPVGDTWVPSDAAAGKSGSGFLLAGTAVNDARLGGEQLLLALSLDAQDAPLVLRESLEGPAKPVKGVILRASRDEADGVHYFEFSASLPRSLFPRLSYLNAMGMPLRKDSPILTGDDVYTFLRPMMWGPVTFVRRP